MSWVYVDKCPECGKHELEVDSVRLYNMQGLKIKPSGFVVDNADYYEVYVEGVICINCEWTGELETRPIKECENEKV